MAGTQEFSFLITTDNHLGYKDDDHMRHKDSYLAFREALELGRQNEVDFILLGGDLFHACRPSANVELECIKILRHHMQDLGPAGSQGSATFKRIGGNFSHFYKIHHANFEDPNLSVRYPILTIHGNHDLPTGSNSKSVCEKLATSGLLNYFGDYRLQEQHKVVVEPIVLQKGSLKIALYGMGFVPDKRLIKAFEQKQVEFAEPPEDSYNVLVVHQNRLLTERNIPDDMYPQFFHLLIRGHEHDTREPEARPGSQVEGLVYQPGSTVATSIRSAEVAPKKVAIFRIRPRETSTKASKSANRFEVSYNLINIKCQRPMILRDISLKEIQKYIQSHGGCDPDDLACEEYKALSADYVEKCIRELLGLPESTILRAGRPSALSTTTHSTKPTRGRKRVARGEQPDKCEEIEKEKPLGSTVTSTLSSQDSTSSQDAVDQFKLPLLRVRIEFTRNLDKFDAEELNNLFYPNKVANKQIVFYKEQKIKKNRDGENENITFADDDDADDDDTNYSFAHVDLVHEIDTVDQLIERYFDGLPESQQLKVLSIHEYTKAVLGSQEDRNVIAMTMSEKRTKVMNLFEEQMKSGKLIPSHYHSRSKVEFWLIEAFSGKPKRVPLSLGGEEPVIIEL